MKIAYDKALETEFLTCSFIFTVRATQLNVKSLGDVLFCVERDDFNSVSYVQAWKSCNADPGFLRARHLLARFSTFFTFSQIIHSVKMKTSRKLVETSTIFLSLFDITFIQNLITFVSADVSATRDRYYLPTGLSSGSFDCLDCLSESQAGFAFQFKT